MFERNVPQIKKHTIQGQQYVKYKPLKYNSGNYQILSNFVKALYPELEDDQRKLR